MAGKLVVIGCGMATARLLESLMAKDFGGVITVIGDEKEPSYNRILLSSLLSGEASAADLPLLEHAFYKRHNINLITGDRVVNVDVTEKSLRTASGLTVTFDTLVFATGSRAHLPSLPGIDCRDIVGFRRMSDLHWLRSTIQPDEPVVVVGGGLLGLEAAHGLNTMGARVTVVHRQPYLMNRQLDACAGNMLKNLLEKRNIVFQLNSAPQKILTDGASVTGLQLDNGDCLPASKILFAAGIDPNKELAEKAGIECDRGICVDDTLATSAKSIFAIGECCQVGEMTFGLVAPVYEQAEVLAANLCGDNPCHYVYRDAPTQLKVSGIDLFSAGRIVDEESQDQVVKDDQNGIYRRVLLKNNRIMGIILLGDRQGGSWLYDLMDQGCNIESIRPWLVFGEAFSLAS
jgi:nitrite reductase (NADH) large subunit